MAQPLKGGREEGESRRARVHILPSPPALARAAAGRLWGIARERAASGTAHFALSGGNTPRAAYGLLASEPYRSGFPWNTVHFWQVDERFVPADDPRSNRKMIREVLLVPAGVSPDRFHGIDTSLPDPEAAAAAYGTQLREVLPRGSRGLPRFDAIVLGIGADGHTASLFPGIAPSPEGEEPAVPSGGGDPPVPRVSVSLSLINAAARVIFLVQGKGKAKAMFDLVAASRDASLRTPGFPAGMVSPSRGNLLFLADAEAGSLLPASWIYT